jgi:hypothetical protein
LVEISVQPLELFGTLIWRQLPQYNTQPPPEFSQGWLTRFKQRHDIHKNIHYRETSSVPDQAIEEMKSIQTLLGEYEENNVYNMDETGLYQRRSPSSGLSTQSRAGVKKDKSRISVALCANVTGTDRLPLLFTGRFKTPQTLRYVNISAMGAVWRSNKKA